MKLQLHAHVHSVSSQVRIPSCSYMPDPAVSLSQDSWFSCSRCNINIIALVIFLTSVLGFIVSASVASETHADAEKLQCMKFSLHLPSQTVTPCLIDSWRKQPSN